MKFIEMEKNNLRDCRTYNGQLPQWLMKSNEDNHAKHTRDFTERMRKIVTPENLKLQLSKEPRALFVERKFIYLFRRQSSNDLETIYFYIK